MSSISKNQIALVGSCIKASDAIVIVSRLIPGMAFKAANKYVTSFLVSSLSNLMVCDLLIPSHTSQMFSDIASKEAAMLAFFLFGLLVIDVEGLSRVNVVD